MTRPRPERPVFEQVDELLSRFPEIRLGVVFGSVASGRERPDSDIDVAVQADKPLTTDQRMAITEALALRFNRPVDLVDLRTAGQPLLDQILDGGVQVLGKRHLWGELIFRNIMDHEDFVPYQNRILEERRRAWINNS